MLAFFQKAGYIFRFRVVQRAIAFLRKLWFASLGMKVGKQTFLPKLFITWPHQVSIGSHCNIEHLCHFKYDGYWKKGPSIVIGNRVFIGEGCEFNIRESLLIGDRCLIASGCRFIDHDHGIAGKGPIRGQKGRRKNIALENDVWLGCNVVVLKGVTIGEGAVIAAGAVVTKPVLPFEIWAGVPAKKIGERK